MQLQNKGKKLENARVLTSSEFLHELEEKEKLKAEKETQKQLWKQQREEKKPQKTGAKSHSKLREWVKQSVIICTIYLLICMYLYIA